MSVQTTTPETGATGKIQPSVETVVKGEAPKPTPNAPKPSGETDEQPKSSASFGVVPIVGGAALLILLVGGGILLAAKRE